MAEDEQDDNADDRYQVDLLILAGADVNQWDIFGEAPLFNAIDLRRRIDGGSGGSLNTSGLRSKRSCSPLKCPRSFNGLKSDLSTDAMKSPMCCVPTSCRS